MLAPVSSVACKTEDSDPLRSFVRPHPLAIISSPSNDRYVDGGRQTIPALLEISTLRCNFRSDTS